MKHARLPLRYTLHAAAIAAFLLCSAAHADEYSDVSQLIRAGQLTQASAKADQFLAGKPKDPQMRFLKGVIQRDSGKTADAITTFTRLTQDYPELPEPYNNLAVLYAGQSQFDKARISLEMAIRTNPSYATAHENLGDVYAKLASQAYNKALQLDTANQAVPPKLALIRELFNPAAKGQRPTTVPPTLPSPASTTATVTAANKPVPSLPTPGVRPAPAASAPSVAPVAVAALGAANPTSSATNTGKPAATAAGANPVASTSAGTPSVSSSAIRAPGPVATTAAASNSSRDVETAIRNWATAWSNKDVKAYLATYAKDFDPPGNQRRNEWEEERRQRILGKSKISVKVEALNITVDGIKATARFRQDYRADGLFKGTRKTMELVRSGDRWLIVRETTGN